MPSARQGQSTQEPPQPWEGDHTDLVHVLWAAEHDGLTLADDFDEIASRIMRSSWIAAVRHHAVQDDRSSCTPDDVSDAQAKAGAEVLRALLGDLGTDEELEQMARGVLTAARRTLSS